MTKEEQKEYKKAYYTANKERQRAQMKAWYEDHKEEQKIKMKAWKESHKESVKLYQKAWKQEHKEIVKAYKKAWREEHKDYQKAYRKAFKEKRIAYSKAYSKKEINSIGQTKGSIRAKSQRILKQLNLHINGYEIHHCFGYEDASKFIYISKSLHLKIHKFLRDNNIDASTNHWMAIRDIVNNTNDFTYIKC